MVFVTNTIDAVCAIVHMLLSAYIFIVLAACIITWFNLSPWHSAVRVLRQLTEPVFNVIRRRFPVVYRFGGLDLSPLVVIIALELIDLILVRSLRQMAMGL